MTRHAKNARRESDDELLDRAFDGLEEQVPDRLTRLIRWLRDPKSRIIRIPLGILFICASFFWFLPVVGVEFLPMGLLLIAQDVPILRRPVAKMMLWLEKKWAEQRRQLTRDGALAGYLLGVAAGGLFEAILLQQILQWHHVLQGVRWEPLQQANMQVLADGLFQLAMVVVAAAGAWSLWRGRHSPDLLAGRVFSSHLLIGFGAWHVLDAFVSHWFLGMHRIRMDVDNPLLWDLPWFVAFGVCPLLAGLLLSRRRARASDE